MALPTQALGIVKLRPSFVAYARWMQIGDTRLRDVKLLQPKRYRDERGWFAETFNADTFRTAGLPGNFVQDNQSLSISGVLRGLHYQVEQPQGKLIRVLSGRIWDVAVDLRRDSPDFGKWAGFDLQPRNPGGELEMLWIPEGFAHGFLVLSESAEVLYKTTRGYYPAGERTILWNDPTLAIEWPLHELGARAVSVSPKDAAGTAFQQADLF